MRTIEYVTHASLFFKGPGLNLLTDPFYWFDPLPASVMVHFPPRRLEPADFGPIHFLYSSHIHPDHSHPDTLRKLHGQVGTVLLPADRHGLEERYRSLGYTDIRLLQNGTTMWLTDTLQVTSYWSDPIDTCLVVQLGDHVAIHLNDCLPTMELAHLIGTRHRIEYAFMLYTSAQDLFPFLLPRPQSELAELARAREATFLVEQIERLRRLRPRVVVPYSMTMTWFQADQRYLNGLHRLLPRHFADAVTAALPDTRCQIVQPGDVLDLDQQTVIPGRTVDDWGSTLHEYLGNLSSFAENNPTLPPFDRGRFAAVADRLRQHLVRFVQRKPPPGFEALYQFLRRGIQVKVVGEDGEIVYFVDLLTRRITEAGWPVVEMTVPASIVAAMLDGFYDPYSLLFLHRTVFRLNSLATVRPEVESALYMMTFMLLLCDNPFEFVAAESVNSLELS